MSRYENYLDTGIPWLGKIPASWHLKKVKYLVKILNGQDHKNVWDENGEYPIVGTGGIFGKANKFLYEGPSVLLGRKGTIDKPQYWDTPFWTVDTAYYTRILPGVDPKFFYYCCKLIPFDLFKYGSAVPSMTQETLNQIKFALPSLQEQSVIASYLDTKSSQINLLLSRKQDLIKLLNEELNNVIDDLLNEGNESWTRKKLKYIARLQSGDSITSEKIAAQGRYPVYGGNGLRGYTATFTHNGYHILIGRQGALCGNINFASEKFFASEHAIVLTLKDSVDTQWLGELLKNMNLNQYSLASAQPGLSVDRIRNLDILVPPLDVQKQIVEKINIERKRINDILKRIYKEVELIKEYETGLISEVITGKLNVINSR